jgi:hypothetical protein
MRLDYTHRETYGVKYPKRPSAKRSERMRCIEQIYLVHDERVRIALPLHVYKPLRG